MTRCAIGACIVWALAALGCGGGDIAVYETCEASEGCAAPADACWAVDFLRVDDTRGTGAFCSLRCETNADCPGGGVCMALAGDLSETYLCYATCGAEEACPSGLRCTPLQGEGVGSDDACLP